MKLKATSVYNNVTKNGFQKGRKSDVRTMKQTKKTTPKQSRHRKDMDNKVMTHKNQDGILTLGVFFISCWARPLLYFTL